MPLSTKKDSVAALILQHERENQEIAAALHDSIGQLLSTTLLHLKDYKKKPLKREKQLVLAIELLQKASEELREIYSFIYPAILEHLGLPDTIEWYSDKFLRENSVACVTDIHLGKRLPQAIELNLFRITQEILSNIKKHSKADKVHIILLLTKNTHNEQTSEEVLFSIKDNGIGFVVKNTVDPHSYGLQNIKTRVRNVHGHFRLTSSEKGTQWTIRIPLDGQPDPKNGQ